MKAETYFVAGTDTGVGKTRVTAALLAAGRSIGMSVAGMKPIASGAERIDGRLASADALQLAAASGQTTAYEDLNPYCLEEAISPHIAAKIANIAVDIAKIAAISVRLRNRADLLLIEGAGGWYTPIGTSESMADLARALGAPVLLVVGLKLGCLNHARLSREAIVGSGCRFAGWIGNHIDPGFAALEENLATLNQLMGAEALGRLQYSHESGHDAAQMRGALERLLATARGQNT
jgi:dethiobiotin synthetase